MRSTAVPRAARAAVATIFLVNGTALGSWVSRIPAVQRDLGLSEGQLGLALLGAGIGALVAMPFSGVLIARWGSRGVTTVAGLLLCAVLVLPALAWDQRSLWLALALLGATNAVMDVAMNAQATEVEGSYGRPIMSSFHGLFSVGGLAGAAAGGVVATFGVRVLPHLLGAGLVLGAVAWAASRPLLPSDPRTEGERGPAFARPTRALAGLGIVTLCAMLGEGAMADWSGVYLERSLGTSAGFAAAGFSAFSLAMAVGRLGGDKLSEKLGPVALVRGGGALTALGLGAGLLARQPLAAVVGFACVGLGLSIVVPVTFSAAGRMPGVGAGPAIAAVASTGYTGFLIGPPLIGFGAELTSLPFALGVVALLGVGIVVLAGSVGPAGAPTERAAIEAAEA